MALLMLTLHIVTYAYAQGKRDARLNSIEEAVKGHDGTREMLASLSATVHSLNQTVGELKEAIHDIAPRVVRQPRGAHG